MDIDVHSLRQRRADQRWNRMVVGDMFERVTWSSPDKIALTGWVGAYSDERFARLSYRQVDEAANQVAHALIDEGLVETDRVLLYCENSIEAIVTLFGIAKAGLVAVPVNPNLADDVLAWAVDHVEARFAVVDGAFAERAAPILDRAGCRLGVTIPLGGPVAAGSRGFHEWIADAPNAEVDGPRHADDVWSILFTSGTTSMPKAVMATHTYSYMAGFAYAMSLSRGLEHDRDLVICTFLPILYHCGHNASVLPAVLSGGSLVVGRVPDAAALADAVTATKVTAVWAGSPAWAHNLALEGIARPDVDLSSITVLMFSWGAMNPTIADDITNGVGPQAKMLEVFGQTEAMSCYRFWPSQYPDKFEQVLGGTNYVGVPNPILAGDIVDADGASLQGHPGIAGEAVYRSPCVTAGYYKDEVATREAFRGGWFHSGDSCRYDADGLQVMVDRFKDIVKSGGENVSSVRVEAVVAGHPDVERVAVIGVPDPKWGERVVAVVTPRAGHSLDTDAVIVYARERLAGFEAPKQVVVVDALPQTVGGKIMKYRLRQELSA
ncbi:class I adenylate-forming enzyme family protein [Gordonia polyisoprenivorans]|uniref:class I adenylate-forming enzyme family protein n=1 Tax=Gordonia polyisoprenivorans TaxID=84595 RepID=UPI000B99F25A|nr:AMP-binding protein [Gordonia polyisoprenivorans]OZC29431.1 AMP-dependent synthetase [Gordonia polyisoprenivorans]